MLEPSEVDEEERRKEDHQKWVAWERIARRIRHPDHIKQVLARIELFKLLSQYDREHCVREPVEDDDYLYYCRDKEW